MSFTYTPEDLIAGTFPIRTGIESLLRGSGTLVRGTVLGKVGIGSVTTAVPAAPNANTGDGTITMDTTTPTLAGAQVGVYKAVCTTEALGSGTFRVYDPSGVVLGDVVVAATFANQIKFVIGAGTADWDVGDTISITVKAGSGYLVKSLAAATDGSQVPYCILADNYTLAAAAETSAVVYKTGDFNQEALTYGTGHTAATVKAALEDRNIYLHLLHGRS